MSTSSNNIDYARIEQEAKCNWCRNPMYMSAGEGISDKNFIETGKKYPALYCNDCLAQEFRVKQPKTAINPNTLDEFNLEDLPDLNPTAAVQQETSASGNNTTDTTI